MITVQEDDRITIQDYQGHKFFGHVYRLPEERLTHKRMASSWAVQVRNYPNNAETNMSEQKYIEEENVGVECETWEQHLQTNWDEIDWGEENGPRRYYEGEIITLKNQKNHDFRDVSKMVWKYVGVENV